MNPKLVISALILLIGSGWFPFSDLARGQYHVDFESAVPSWKRSESDCVVASHRWKQTRVNDPKLRNRFERIEFQNGPGAQLFIAHDVRPALVIPELNPSVRIRMARPGARLYARVVLPKTPAPDGKGPMKVLLRGPTYQKQDQWQTLSFDQLGTGFDEILQQEIWLLRTKHANVTSQGAYLDKLAINIYTGEGTHRVDLDDLKVDGWVTDQDITEYNEQPNGGQVRPASFNQDQESGRVKSLANLDGSVLLVNKQPFFPRIIQHRGESFEYLKALGFNVLELERTATEQQLRSAQKLDLWLICPPPSSVGLKPIEFQFDRVLAWTVGNQLDARDLPVVEQRVREIRESDRRYGRPIMGHAVAEWSQLSRLTDIVGAGIEPIGTSFLASQYSQWLLRRKALVGDSKPIWADVQTELTPALVSQIKTLTLQVPPIPVEPQQIKYLCYEAIAGGCRGLRFRSTNRLDGVDPVSRLRAMTLEWTNRHLLQLEPWIVGGALMGAIPLPDAGPELTVTALNTNRSRLLLVQRSTHHEQYLAGDMPLTKTSFHDSSSPYTNNAYLIGTSGLQTLPNARSVTGIKIDINDCPSLAAVVLTQDPLVVNQLTRSYQAVGQQTMLSLHAELTRQWLAIEQLIVAQINNMGRSSDQIQGLLADAAAASGTAQSMLQQGNDQVAEQYLLQADQRLASVRRELIIDPLGMFQSKTSAPLTTHASLIPLHWELAARLGEGQWSPNSLPGGDFEDLEMMQSHGWQNRRLDHPATTTNVHLVPPAAVDGRYGLKMTVEPRPGNSSNMTLESPPLQIESPVVSVRAGQLIRIHGWINVPEVITGSLDGLRITDSLGGPEMAERIPITNGWQEFTLYRGAPNHGQISVRFELTGFGTALLDEVTIRTIDLPVARQADVPGTESR